MAAEKEATVFILDLGKPMGECHNGRIESDLDWSMRYVWDRISSVVSLSRKTLNVGVIGVRTDGTSNSMQNEDGYENISVLQELGPMDMAGMKSLQQLIVPSHTSTGDSISAIVLAIGMIETLTKKLKYNRKMVLVTDGQAPVDPDDFEDISSKIKQCNIELTILGVDFDDTEFGFKEEDKTALKAKNESLFKQLVDACDGSYGTIAEAIAELDTPRIKSWKPYKCFAGPLTLGDPALDNRAMSINVERYFKTKKFPLPSANNVVLKSDQAIGSQSTQTLDEEKCGAESSGGAFAAVKNAQFYKVNDPDAPGGKKDVERDALAKGYQYGRTAVHISEAEFNITKLETQISFSIIGFIPESKFESFWSMGPSCLTVAQKFDEASALKLSSLIHSLHELESYAVARLVSKNDKQPELLLLAPFIDNDFECLYDIPLPFAEDVRPYEFPPLDKVITVNKKEITKHRHLPSQDLLETMSEYVDAMDISTYELDDNGERTLEYAAVDDVYHPMAHRINQTVRHRAIYPGKGVPPILPILLKYARPEEQLVATAKSRLDDLMEVAEVKKVPPKAIGKRSRNVAKPISNLDVDALLKAPQNKRVKLNPDNAIPEFKQMIDTADDDPVVEEAAKQMGHVILELIKTSTMGNLHFDRVIEYLRVLREKMMNNEVPDLYNTFVRDLKKRLLSGELNGDKRELWWEIKKYKLGLIDKDASDGVSKVTADEAGEFYKK